MDLGHSGWLGDLLGRILAGYDPALAMRRFSAMVRGEGEFAALAPEVRARRHVDQELRRSGLINGSPKLPSRVTQGTRLDRAEALFLAVLAGESFVALDVARILGVPFDRLRAEAELTMLLAAAAGATDLAEELRLRALAKPGTPHRTFDRLQARIGAVLLERLALVTGDSRFDLPLHNGMVYGEARTVGRLSVEWYRRGRFRPERAQRMRRIAARERAALLETLLALSLIHHPPTDAERRSVRRELRRLPLPRAVSRNVLASIELPPSPRQLAGTIRSRPLREFVIEQVYLSAIVDGTIDEGEERFLRELSREFGIGKPEQAALEARVADYFYDPDDVLDAFEVLRSGQAASEALVDRISRELAQNLDRVANEVKETGELTQLLAKVARGGRLDAAERAKAREQLLDLARVVPSLALIAAPGGMLLFAALLKVLPFSILPSSFVDKPGPPPVARKPRAPSPKRPRR